VAGVLLIKLFTDPEMLARHRGERFAPVTERFG